MSEPEFRDLCRRILAEPDPPMVAGSTILAAARRARRRRQLVRGIAAGAGTAAMASAAAILAIGLGAPRQASPAGSAVTGAPARSAVPATSPPTTAGPAGATGAPAATGASPSGAATATPAADPRQAYADRMLAGLLAAIPPGFTTPAEPVLEVGGSRYQVQGTQVNGNVSAPPSGEVHRWYIVASTDVYRGAEVAAVSVSAATTGVTADGDLCLVPVMHQGSEAGCQVATATGGAAVRLAWRDVTGYGRIWYASRFYPGWVVTVQQSPGGMTPDRSAYGQPVFDESQLVDLATAPSFQPG